MNILCKRIAACAGYAVWPVLLTFLSGYVYSQCTRTITGSTVAQIIVLTGETVCVNSDLLVTGDVEVEGGGRLVVASRVRLVAGSVTCYGIVEVGANSYLYVQSGALFDGPIASITLNQNATAFVCNGVNVSDGGRVYMHEGTVFDSFHSNFLLSSNYIQYVGPVAPALRPYFISRASVVLQGTLSNSAELGYCSQFPGASLTQARLGLAQNACTPIVPAVILQATHCNIVSPFYYNAILPVRFEYVTAYADANRNQVLWTIEDDNTVERYEVERSESNSNYSRLAVMTPPNNDHITRTYTFTDSLNNAKQPSYYYRVKAVRWNGSSFYSPVRRVQNRGTVDVLRISPNPVRRTLSITMPIDRQSNSAVKIDVVNAEGQTLYSQSFRSRNSVVTVDQEVIARMATGQYYVRVNTGNRLYVSRFLKE